ncbi:dipeptide epimerase [Halobacteriales archaeon QS_4_69_31]|nr:MAG: dipeptide epimerase [Halobacteriales archaeon QS_4_69_31]
MNTGFERLSLPLADPFTIARGTTETAENVLVRVEGDDGRVGLGAAAPSRYYGETADTVEALLPELLGVVEDVGDPLARERVARRLRERAGDNPAARAAVDTALADLAGKRLGVPLYRLWGLDPDGVPASSFTLGLADPGRMREKAEAATEQGFDVLKVKVGAGDGRDADRLAAVRAGAPDARVRVDANGAWTPAEAVEMTDRLADHGVEFVEQPVAATGVEGLRFVREQGALPVAADESVVTAADVPRVAGAVDIVVAKLMKCGSLRETRRVASVARAHDCEAMVGCMVESSAAIAAAWHLAPLFDYADLDGSLLLAEDPVEGLPLAGATADLAAVDRPGTGALER